MAVQVFHTIQDEGTSNAATDDGPVIDLNPEDWRELADGELAELRSAMIEHTLETRDGERT